MQPPTTEQIKEYLSRAGKSVAAIRVALQRSQVLQELTTTPLMLSILTLAYQGKSVEELLT